MKITLEELTGLILKELILELKKRGIEIDFSTNSKIKSQINFDRYHDHEVKLNFEGFKTPLVTEKSILKLNREVSELIVPRNTIFTPSSLDLINKRKIKIIKK